MGDGYLPVGTRFIASERIAMHPDHLPYRREQACLFLPGFTSRRNMRRKI